MYAWPCLFLVVIVRSKPLHPNFIVGGDYVVPGSYPWLVNRKNMCAGALITPDWFVTAGHCDMVVGEYVDYHRFNMLAYEPLAERHQVAELVVYPSYDISDTRTDLHDLQLVRLATSAKNTPLARLATAEEIPLFEAPGFMLTVAGWGSSSPDPGSPTESRLRATSVPVISNKVCNDSSHYGANSPPWLPKPVYSTMLCAGFEQGGHDSCLGDSGAPLFTEVNGTGVLVGIVSWAVGCARALRPGVYTRLSAYRGWIEDTISNKDSNTRELSMSSCVSNCGEVLSLCSCDGSCLQAGDCCPDYYSQCIARAPNVIVPVETTCANRCDAVGDGCRCDASCTFRADCCVDYYQFCHKLEATGPQRSNSLDRFPPTYYGSCENVCGTLSSLLKGGYCYCDPNCYVHNDCCSDFEMLCVNETRSPSSLSPTPFPTPASVLPSVTYSPSSISSPTLGLFPSFSPSVSVSSLSLLLAKSQSASIGSDSSGGSRNSSGGSDIVGNGGGSSGASSSSSSSGSSISSGSSSGSGGSSGGRSSTSSDRSGGGSSSSIGGNSNGRGSGDSSRSNSGSGSSDNGSTGDGLDAKGRPFVVFRDEASSIIFKITPTPKPLPRVLTKATQRLPARPISQSTPSRASSNTPSLPPSTVTTEMVSAYEDYDYDPSSSPTQHPQPLSQVQQQSLQQRLTLLQQQLQKQQLEHPQLLLMLQGQQPPTPQKQPPPAQQIYVVNPQSRVNGLRSPLPAPPSNPQTPQKSVMSSTRSGSAATITPGGFAEFAAPAAAVMRQSLASLPARTFDSKVLPSVVGPARSPTPSSARAKVPVISLAPSIGLGKRNKQG